MREAADRDGRRRRAAPRGGGAGARRWRDRLRARLPRLRAVYVGEVGAVVGAHVGPGMLGVVVAPAALTASTAGVRRTGRPQQRSCAAPAQRRARDLASGRARTVWEPARERLRRLRAAARPPVVRPPRGARRVVPGSTGSTATSRRRRPLRRHRAGCRTRRVQPDDAGRLAARAVRPRPRWRGAAWRSSSRRVVWPGWQAPAAPRGRLLPRSSTPPASIPQSAASGAGAPGDFAAVRAGGPRPAGRVAPVRCVVDVEGRVRRPGLVHLPPGSRVADAPASAGGAHLGRGGLPPEPRARAGGRRAGARSRARRPAWPTAAPAAAPGAPAASAPGRAHRPQPLDLNAATPAGLDGLPGVGPVLAGRIVAWRAAARPVHVGGRARRGAGHRAEGAGAVAPAGPGVRPDVRLCWSRSLPGWRPARGDRRRGGRGPEWRPGSPLAGRGRTGRVAACSPCAATAATAAAGAARAPPTVVAPAAHVAATAPRRAAGLGRGPRRPPARPQPWAGWLAGHGRAVASQGPVDRRPQPTRPGGARRRPVRRARRRGRGDRTRGSAVRLRPAVVLAPAHRAWSRSPPAQRRRLDGPAGAPASPGTRPRALVTALGPPAYTPASWPWRAGRPGARGAAARLRRVCPRTPGGCCRSLVDGDRSGLPGPLAGRPDERRA